MQYAEPKCHTLNTNIFTPSLNIFPAWRPVPHVDEGDGGVEAGHHDVRHAEVQQEVVGHTPHPPVRCNIQTCKINRRSWLKAATTAFTFKTLLRHFVA